jgi:hypothetical protein
MLSENRRNEMNWSPLLQPIEEGAATVAALAITAGIGVGLKWLRAHLTALNGAATASSMASMNGIVQSAATNASGSIVADIRAGILDIADSAGLQTAAATAAAAVAAKVPVALATLEPAEGAVAEMVLQKTHLALAGVATALPPKASLGRHMV